MKLNRGGLLATIIYHLLLLLLMIFAGMKFPDPPPEEEGILLNFGTSDTGFGQYEPVGDDQQAGDPELPVVDQPEEIMEEVAEPLPAEIHAPVETTLPDQTQDLEETRVREEAKPDPKEIERQREEQERIRREREEQKRIEQERIEQERREEQERIERERQQQAERLNNAGRNAFGNQSAGNASGSQGEAGGTGNQGNINGSPDTDRYGTGGGLGDGITFGGLGSRQGSVPKPNLSGCEVTQRIVITVDIQVDRDGKVVSANIGNSTFTDNCINEMVLKAARQSSFAPDLTANYRQTGWIRYIIVP
jgi:colicin import membrane protein